MAVLVPFALGFAALRGFMLAALTVPWLAQKLRAPGITQAERSLVVMVGSRAMVLGGVLLALWFTNRREALGWGLLGDGLLQLVDTALALALGARRLAVLPGLLCVLDALAGLALLG